MASQVDTNKVTSSTEIAEMRQNQERETWLAIRQEASELNAEGPARYEYYVTKERVLTHRTEAIISGIESLEESNEIQDGLMAELVTQRNKLEFNIVTARMDVSNLKEELKEKRICYKNLFRRNEYIQSLRNEEKTLLAELAELKKKNTRK